MNGLSVHNASKRGVENSFIINKILSRKYENHLMLQ